MPLYSGWLQNRAPPFRLRCMWRRRVLRARRALRWVSSPTYFYLAPLLQCCGGRRLALQARQSSGLQCFARKLSARGSVCRDRRFRGATLRKSALRRPAVRLAATNGVARRDVFLLSRRPPRSLFLALPAMPGALMRPSKTCSGLGALGFRCGCEPQARFCCGLARFIAARGTPSPRPLTAVRLLGCPRAAPTSHGPRGGSTQSPPRTPTY